MKNKTGGLKNDPTVNNNVKYRGVGQRKWGSFNAVIGNQKKNGSRVWLGTFRTAIEAARAYDKAAIKMYGTKAILNFPTHIPIEESNHTLPPVARKRKRPSRYSPSPSISRHSPSVGLNGGNGRRDYFRWTDDHLVALCNVLKKHITTDNESCQSKWDDLKLEFEEVVQHKFNTVAALRSKYDAMTKKYNLWKLLKDGEIGLLWIERTQELDCSYDWWKSKIQDNPEFKKLWKRQPSKELQEAWNRLYEDVVDDGVNTNSVASSEDVHKLNEAPGVSLEILVAERLDNVMPSVDRKDVNFKEIDLKRSNEVPCVSLENVVADGLDNAMPSVDPKDVYLQDDDPKTSNEAPCVSVVANRLDSMMPSVHAKDVNLKAVDPKKSNEAPCVSLENVVADRLDSMVPSVDPKDVNLKNVDPKKSNDVAYVNLESDDDDLRGDESLDVPVQHTLQHSSQFGNMETEEVVSISNFINEEKQEDQGDGSRRSQKMAKTDIKPEPITRGSNRATMVKQAVTEQYATQQSVAPHQVAKTSIDACISVISRMVDEGLLAECSDLWCFAVNLFVDGVKRELFMSLPDNVGRLAWLFYRQKLGY